MLIDYVDELWTWFMYVDYEVYMSYVHASWSVHVLYTNSIYVKSEDNVITFVDYIDIVASRSDKLA